MGGLVLKRGALRYRIDRVLQNSIAALRYLARPSPLALAAAYAIEM
jgi:hypothetical protein